MTLVGSSVWIERFRRPDAWLQRLLAAGAVLGHPHGIGEPALGRSPERDTTLRRRHRLPQPRVAGPDESRSSSSGTGWPARLWSGDRRLAAAAGRLGLGAQPDA